MDTTHCSQNNGGGQQIIKAVDEKKPKLDEKVNCPRCNSTNTKFCYYNNYSLSQPRYLCKTCKRYWTHGGSLRNVPVGGGSRKKHKKSSNKLLISPPPPHEVPKTTHHPQTLNLGSFNPSHYNHYGSSSSDLFGFGTHQNPNDLSSNFSIMDLFKSTTNTNVISSSSGLGLSSFPGSESNSVYLPGLPVHDGLSFSLNGIENGFQDHDINASRIMLPFEELKQPQHVNATGFHDKEKEQGGLVNGYNWNNGMATGNPSSW